MVSFMSFEASLNSLIPRPIPLASSGIFFAPNNNTKSAMTKNISPAPRFPKKRRVESINVVFSVNSCANIRLRSGIVERNIFKQFERLFYYAIITPEPLKKA